VVLIDFLCTNDDIFTWSPSDMPGIPWEVAEHSLDILPHSRAVQQLLRRFDEEQRRAIGVELRKLLEAGFIKEVFHPTWLVSVRKVVPTQTSRSTEIYLSMAGAKQLMTLGLS
jgi:hypothetical protein